MIVVALSTYACTAVVQSIVEHDIESAALRIPIVSDAYVALERCAKCAVDNICIRFLPVGGGHPIFACTACRLIGVDFNIKTSAYVAAFCVVDYGLHFGERLIIVAIDRSRAGANVRTIVVVAFDKCLEFLIVVGKCFVSGDGEVGFVTGSHADDSIELLGTCVEKLVDYACTVVRTVVAAKRKVDNARLVVFDSIVEHIFHAYGYHIVEQVAASSHNVGIVSHAVVRIESDAHVGKLLIGIGQSHSGLAAIAACHGSHSVGAVI